VLSKCYLTYYFIKIVVVGIQVLSSELLQVALSCNQTALSLEYEEYRCIYARFDNKIHSTEVWDCGLDVLPKGWFGSQLVALLRGVWR
jgi:hypothetical protein